jgi:hypothetical protein
MEAQNIFRLGTITAFIVTFISSSLLGAADTDDGYLLKWSRVSGMKPPSAANNIGGALGLSIF